MAVFDISTRRAMDVPDSPVVETRNEVPAAVWSPLARFAFRFAFPYLVVYLLQWYVQLLDFVPGIDVVAGWYDTAWNALAMWVARHLFHVDAPLRVTGSGDSMFSWVETLCLVTLSLLVAMVWTLLDRRRMGYTRLYHAWKVYVQVGLGLVLIVYGGLKVVPSQFPRPPVSRLLQPFGDASPMGVLWTFMGASAPYTIFGGLAELIPGLLLVFRRTASLGALLAIPVLTNIVMLNYCYDVPVKLLSTHLLVIAIGLAVPDMMRLAGLLVLHRPVAPAAERPFFRRRGWQIAALVVEVAVAVGFTASIVRMGYVQLASFYKGERSPLEGIWNVDDLKIDGRPRDAQTAEGLQWRRLVFDSATVLAVQSTGDSRQRFNLKLDAAHKTLALTRRDDPQWKSALTYGRPAADRLALDGTFAGHRVQASLHHAARPKFLLESRGFHWINEYPFNR